MREIVHLQAGQCGNQIGAKVGKCSDLLFANNVLAKGRANINLANG